MSEEKTAIIIAVIAATPILIASLASWHAARKTRQQVTPGNGIQLSTMVEHIHEEVDRQGSRLDALHESQLRHLTDLDIHRDRRRGAR